MRWFKHRTDAADGEFLSELISIFGLEGYARWWILLEKIGARMDKTDCCSATYPWEKWQRYLVIRRQKLRSYLLHIEQKGKINLIETNNLLTIEIPNLLKIRDNYSKNLQATDKKLASKEVDKEVDKEKEKEVVCTEPETGTAPPAVFIEIPLHKNGTIHRVTVNDVDTYRLSFPRLDVHQVLRNIRQYFLDNPTKRKTPRGIGRCISSWMMRDQDAGRNLLAIGRLPEQPKRDKFPKDVTCPNCGEKTRLMFRADICRHCNWQYYERRGDGDWHVREPMGAAGPVNSLVSKVAEKRSA